MRHGKNEKRQMPLAKKETTRMPKRPAYLFILVCAAALLGLLPASATATAPWWQLHTGSRPTNLWEPESSLLEIEPKPINFFGEEVLATKIEAAGSVVGCLGTQNELGTAVCEFGAGF